MFERLSVHISKQMPPINAPKFSLFNLPLNRQFVYYLLLFWRHKYYVLTLSLIGSLLCALYLAPMYKPSLFHASALLVSPQSKYLKIPAFSREEYAGFGVATADDLRNVCAHLLSDSVFYAITNRFQLLKHYGYAGLGDSSKMYKYLQADYQESVSINVRKRAFIEIEVYDKDKKLAQNITNELAQIATLFIESILKRREALAQLQNSYAQLVLARNLVQDTLAKLRNDYHLYHVNNVKETFAKPLAIAFQEPKFHQNYDRMLNLEVRDKHYQKALADKQAEIIFITEHLQQYPRLLDIAAPGVVLAIVEKPHRAAFIVLAFFSSMIFALSVVILVDKFVAK